VWKNGVEQPVRVSSAEIPTPPNPVNKLTSTCLCLSSWRKSIRSRGPTVTANLHRSNAIQSPVDNSPSCSCHPITEKSWVEARCQLHSPTILMPINALFTSGDGPPSRRHCTRRSGTFLNVGLVRRAPATRPDHLHRPNCRRLNPLTTRAGFPGREFRGRAQRRQGLERCRRRQRAGLVTYGDRGPGYPSPSVVTRRYVFSQFPSCALRSWAFRAHCRRSIAVCPPPCPDIRKIPLAPKKTGLRF